MQYVYSKLLEKRGAQPDNTLKSSLKAVAACDIYVGIFGKEYSKITIKEYIKAHNDLKPIFVYIKNTRKRDPRLKRFITIQLTNNYKYERFSDNKDIFSKIKHDLKAFLFSTLTAGIETVTERKKKAREQEQKKNHLRKKTFLKSRKVSSEESHKLLVNAEKQLRRGLHIESLINSAFLIEYILRQKLFLLFPGIENESLGQILLYAQDTNIVSDNLIIDIRKVQYLRNDVTHRGIVPSGSDSQFAFNVAKRVAKTAAKRSIKSPRWVASYSIIVSDLRENENVDTKGDIPYDWLIVTDQLKKKLLGLLDSKGLKYQIEEEGGDGETYNIRISFQWDHTTTLLPILLPIDNISPWKLTEVEPYVKIYG